MECELALEKLEDGAAGRLNAEQAVALERHLSACPNCAREARWLSAMKSAIRRQPRAALPPDLRAGLLRAADATEPAALGPLAFLRRYWRPAAGLGFASAFAAAGLLLFVRSGSDTISLDEVLAEHGRYQSTMPTAGREELYAELAGPGEEE